MKIEYTMTDQKIANFIVFPVQTTNIFPLANSQAGGQLVTEYNLRCRDMVTTKSNIEYEVGPSYVHGKKDFHVKTGSDIATSSTVLEITPGRAVINGHFFESMVDVFIDLAELNSELIRAGEKPYTGKLAVGLRAMYSTDATLSGSMLVNKKSGSSGVDMYLGVQVIIGPQNIMKTPEEAGSDQAQMKCHLKLATFSYYNGAIRNIVNLHEKYEWVEAERIGHIDELLEENYVSKKGLNPHRLYTYATKSDAITGQKKDTWCDATRSEFIWDKSPNVSEQLPSDESLFGYDATSGDTFLRLAHMQVDGMTDSYGKNIYYDDKILKLPRANYGLNTGGTVDKTYTQNIKRLAQRIEQYYHIKAGKQIYYMESYTSELTGLPKINSNWDVGDYVLVGLDYVLANAMGSDETRPPSSLYVVLPGYVTGYQFFARGEEDSNELPKDLLGIEIEEITVDNEPASETEVKGKPIMHGLSEDCIELTPVVPGSTVSIHYIQKAPVGSGEDDEEITVTLDPDALDYSTGIIDISKIADIDLRNAIGQVNTTASYYYLASDLDRIIEDYTEYRGIPGRDYFTVVYNYKDTKGVSHFRKYYYVVKSSSAKQWSDAIALTGTFGLATVDNIGGFLNVDDSYQDAGYVILNEEGHLQLMDYALLRTGVLAYQLGENLTLPTGIDTSEVQNYLDDYVNQRVAFPNANQISKASNPNVIDIYIDLVAEEEPTVINIYDIDSRFNTSVYLHFTGSANENTTINILDVEKLRIDKSIVNMGAKSSDSEDAEAVPSGPIINVYRCGLYYDAEVMNYIKENRNDKDAITEFTGMQDIKLWYQMYSDKDPKLFIDGMTVRRKGDKTSSLVNTTNVATWTEGTKVNDYHYSIGLHGVTFSGTGEIVGCSILIRNSSTANVEGEYRSIIYNDLAFPNGDDFKYPQQCITNAMKITGQFITSYANDADSWIIQDTKFSLFMKGYNAADEATTVRASIAIFEESHIIPADLRSEIAGMSLDPWDSRSPHVFFGSILK